MRRRIAKQAIRLLRPYIRLEWHEHPRTLSVEFRVFIVGVPVGDYELTRQRLLEKWYLV